MVVCGDREKRRSKRKIEWHHIPRNGTAEIPIAISLSSFKTGVSSSAINESARRLTVIAERLSAYYICFPKLSVEALDRFHVFDFTAELS